MWVRGSGGGANLQRSTDNGVTWANIAHNVPQSFWDIRCVATDGAEHWVACGSNSSGGNGFAISADNGLTWTYVANPLAGNAVAFAIAYHDGVWVVGAEGGKLARSTDNGATWTQLAGPTVSVNSIAANADAWLATDESRNLWRSTDGGQTWASTSFNTQFGGGFIRNVAGSGTTFIMAGSSSNAQRSASSFPYNAATQFKVPAITAPAGTTAYVKATA
ncbi:BNR/Asp-box repeat protein [compost metagenome]